MFGLKGKPCDSLSHYSFLDEILFVFLLCLVLVLGFSLKICYVLRWRLQGQRADPMSGIRMDGEIHKESIKNQKKFVENRLKLRRNIVEVKHI